MQDAQIFDLFSAFDVLETPISVERNSTGHINDTYEIRAQGGPHTRYILQHVNEKVFTRPHELMENFVRVTQHIYDKLSASSALPARSTIQLVAARAGGYTVVDEQGRPWRMYPKLRHTVTVDRAQVPEQMRQAGLAFGTFQRLLSDFPAKELHEVIPGFHDTGARYEAFERAVRQDPQNRAMDVAPEIAFVRAFSDVVTRVTDLLQSGELPTRVTHNDTKINNVLLDKDTFEAVCVIDLDTVMPGSMLYDFGDAIRSGATTADEDEVDLSRVQLDLDLYSAYSKGFLAALGDAITPLEREMLPFSAVLMTYECGMRFLTDHLMGDTYFRIHRPGHNLDRARNQFALVSDFQRREADMRAALDV